MGAGRRTSGAGCSGDCRVAGPGRARRVRRRDRRLGVDRGLGARLHRLLARLVAGRRTARRYVIMPCSRSSPTEQSANGTVRSHRAGRCSGGLPRTSSTLLISATTCSGRRSPTRARSASARRRSDRSKRGADFLVDEEVELTTSDPSGLEFPSSRVVCAPAPRATARSNGGWPAP